VITLVRFTNPWEYRTFTELGFQQYIGDWPIGPRKQKYYYEKLRQFEYRIFKPWIRPDNAARRTIIEKLAKKREKFTKRSKTGSRLKKKKRRAYRFRQKIKHVKALSKIKKTIKIKEIF